MDMKKTSAPQLQIVLAGELTEGDRFARRDWMESQSRRIDYAVVAPPNPKRKTIDCSRGDENARIGKQEYVYRMTNDYSTVLKAEEQCLYETKDL